MALKITTSGLFHRSYLIMKRDGFKFYQNGMFFGARKFRFEDVSAVLMSPAHCLSFQSGNEVFSIQTKAGNPKHDAVIAALLHELAKSSARAESPLHYSSP